MHRNPNVIITLALFLTALFSIPLAAQPADSINFAIPSLTVLETSGEALIPLVRTGGSGADAVVRLDITPGTATSADYVAAPGRIDPAFSDAELDGMVRALAVQPDGKIIIGGAFTALGDQPRARLARLNADGSLDAGFTAAADGPVTALALQADGAIIVGGFFSTVNGQPRARLARLNADGSLDAGFNPGVSFGSEVAPDGVLTLAVQNDGAILVGGIFSTIAATAQANLARLMPTGAYDADFSPIVNGPVHALLVSGAAAAPRIRIGGNFNEVNGQLRRSLAALTADGALDGDFNPFVNPNGIVYDLAQQRNGSLIVVGFFTDVFAPFSNPPLLRPGIVRLNAVGNLDRTFDLGGTTSGVIQRVAVQPDGKVIIGGQFTNPNLPDQANLARLNADGTPDPSFASGLGPDGPVEALALLTDGALLIGGLFNRYDLDTAAPEMLARVQGDLFVRWRAAEGDGVIKRARLPLVVDGLDEGTETLSLTLTAFGAEPGEPATFTLRIRDSNSDPLALPLNVTSYRSGDIRIMLIGSDADNDPLTYTVMSLPERGTLYQNTAAGRGALIATPNTPVSDPIGRVIFVPEPDAQGAPYASFSYRVNDDFAVSAPATVVVNIEPSLQIYVPIVQR